MRCHVAMNFENPFNVSAIECEVNCLPHQSADMNFLAHFLVNQGICGTRIRYHVTLIKCESHHCHSYVKTVHFSVVNDITIVVVMSKPFTPIINKAI
jgi:hypothetical protein